MSSGRVRLVTFDVTNTLLHFRKPPGELYREVAASYGLTISPRDASANFRSAYKRISEKYPNFGKGTVGWEHWWKTIVKNTFKYQNHDPDKVEQVASDLIRIYKTEEAWVLSEGSVDILRLLKANGVTSGVISNFDPQLEQLLKAHDVHKYFNFVLTSYNADCMKPDPNIFKRALKESKISDISSGESLHIGDDYKNDYEGAKKSGWQAIIITKDCIDSLGKNQFSSLVELFEYFKNNENIFMN